MEGEEKDEGEKSLVSLSFTTSILVRKKSLRHVSMFNIKVHFTLNPFDAETFPHKLRPEKARRCRVDDKWNPRFNISLTLNVQLK